MLTFTNLDSDEHYVNYKSDVLEISNLQRKAAYQGRSALHSLPREPIR